MIALARKYRPKRFSDLLVQDHVAAALRGAVAGARAAHGYVFATTEPQKIAQSAAPILSRLQRFDFRRIGPHAIADRLRHVVTAEGLAADDEALHLIAKSADGGMRDGLSMLDQVVSFGEGPVTAVRVREVLGLISDDIYGELLRLVSERDPKAVFPLVERLVDAGADLGEFVAGAGEIVRAVLLANLGGKPEGFTDALLALIERYRSPLPAADRVRLLAVLSAPDPQPRAGGHAPRGQQRAPGGRAVAAALGDDEQDRRARRSHPVARGRAGGQAAEGRESGDEQRRTGFAGPGSRSPVPGRSTGRLPGGSREGSPDARSAPRPVAADRRRRADEKPDARRA